MTAALVLLVLLLAAALFVKGTVLSGNQIRRMRWRIRFRLRPGPGFATLAEVHFRWSRLAAVMHGRRARPGLTLRHRLCRPARQYAVRLGRAQYGRTAYGRMEDQVLMIAPPRTDKSGQLADRIAGHPGAVLSTSTRADVYFNTAGYRARLGRIDVFNPEVVGGVPSTFGIDILDGCEDPATVIRRADALIGPRAEGGDLRAWQDLAAQTLAMFMHAAALLGATIFDVWRWAHHFGTTAVEQAVRAPGVSLEILAPYRRIQRDNKTNDSIKTIMAGCLGSWIAVPQIARLVSAPLARPLDVRGFAEGCGTLYLITASADSPCAPLFRLIASEVHAVAGLAGSRAPYGRLDPPVLFGLDEVCQICPVPLPRWLSDSAGKGILLHVISHGMGQLRERYGEQGAATIWSTCGTRMFLPGLAEASTLKEISDLCGSVPSETGKAEPVCPPDLVRMLPDHRALVVSRNCSPLVVRVRPIWHRVKHRLRLAPAVPALAPAETEIFVGVSGIAGWRPAGVRAADGREPVAVPDTVPDEWLEGDDDESA